MMAIAPGHSAPGCGWHGDGRSDISRVLMHTLRTSQNKMPQPASSEAGGVLRHPVQPADMPSRNQAHADSHQHLLWQTMNGLNLLLLHAATYLYADDSAYNDLGGLAINRKNVQRKCCR